MLINAANSTMGQLLVQLCAVLRLRCLALVRDHGKHAQNEAWLRGLGAHAVFVDASFSKVGSASMNSPAAGWPRPDLGASACCPVGGCALRCACWLVDLRVKLQHCL